MDVNLIIISCVLAVCGRRYKNGPGLKYHYTHYNHEQETGTTHHEEPVMSHPSTPVASISSVESPKVPSSPPQQRGPGRPKKVPGAATSPNNYCDFCLGDVYENKTTGYPEELLSCADCGRSGRVCILGVTFIVELILITLFNTTVTVDIEIAFFGTTVTVNFIATRPSKSKLL